MAAADNFSERRFIMKKTILNIGIASLILGSLPLVSPVYAQKEKQPSTQSDMMKDGGMDGMMGMMGMMEQMNKMMGLCTKMMESSMEGSDKKMPMESPAAPEKEG